jgi:hypothetical protein
MEKARISFVTVLLIALVSLSAIASPPAIDAPSAFAKLKSLAGDWEGRMPDGSKSQVQYQVVSGGSAVVERFVNDKMGSDNAMVTVYYLDGNRLLLQHYCIAKNQPRMQAESFTPSTGELRFTFLDATGLASPETGHRHSATLHFIDADHVKQDWQFFENSKPKFTESMQFTRVR